MLRQNCVKSSVKTLTMIFKDYYTLEEEFNYNAPPKWFYTVSDVRKGLKRMKNWYHQTNYEENLKVCVLKSFMPYSYWSNEYLNTFELSKISNQALKFNPRNKISVEYSDRYYCERKDWFYDNFRLPSCRFDMYPRRFDGLAVRILDNLQIGFDRFVHNFIANDNIYLILQFCNQPMLFRMKLQNFFQMADFARFSVREMETIWTVTMDYFYREAKKMKSSTTKKDFYLNYYAPQNKEEIINQMSEKAAFFFEMKGNYLKRRHKTIK